jgi:hypothetical protein
MKPKPLVGLNHFTVPTGIDRTPLGAGAFSGSSIGQGRGPGSNGVGRWREAVSRGGGAIRSALYSFPRQM